MIEGMMLIVQIALGVFLGSLLNLGMQYTIMAYKAKKLVSQYEDLMTMYQEFMETDDVPSKATKTKQKTH